MDRTAFKEISSYKVNISLSWLFIFLISVVVIGHIMTRRIPKDEFSEMKQAAKKMQTVFRIIYNARIERGIPIDKVTDPLQSGLIGVEFSPITTTLGNLEAKQISLNVDFAALMVNWLKQCGVEENERVAIQASASFPGLTFAAIIACETLKLIPLVSVSLGASSYGANMPGFTILDMEKILLDSVVIENGSKLITPGGTNDNGTSMWDGSGEIIIQAIKRTGKSLFIPQTLQESIKKKQNFFSRSGKVRVFINIGGNHTSLGNGNCALSIPSGLINKPLNCNPSTTTTDAGLIFDFNRSAIPVIHLLNIRELAAQNGLLSFSHHFLVPGNSAVYFYQKKPIWFYTGSLLIIFVWIIVLKKKIKSD